MSPWPMKGERPSALLFDVGGVLCADALAPKRADLAAKYNIPLAELSRIGSEMRTHVDEGRITEPAYWTALLTAVGITADSDDVAIDPYIRIFDGVPELLAAASETGYLLACLTNDSLDMAAARQHALAEALATTTVGKPPRASVFSHIIVSADVGVQKPDPAIYECAVVTLGMAADECLFIDDKAENLIAAEQLGFRTTQFTSVADLQAQLDGTSKSSAEGE